MKFNKDFLLKVGVVGALAIGFIFVAGVDVSHASWLRDLLGPA